MSRSTASAGLLPIPRHDLIDLIGLVLAGDHTLEHILEIGERFDMVETAGFNDR